MINICIIVFSPSGHTFSVATIMKKAMENRGMNVQLVNITGEERVYKDNKLVEYLNTEVKPHDLLCVGGPVYAGHLEQNVKRIIASLPAVSRDWGGLAIPFVTYGGLHSSIALIEAGELLFKSGRKIVLGMKAACFHTLTATLNKKINHGKPDAETEEVINGLVERLKDLFEKNEFVDVRKSFAYASFKEKIIFRLLSQEFFHRKYRGTVVDTLKCSGCGICVRNCPVRIIELKNKKAVVKTADRCILCAECYHRCPNKAVNYVYYNKVKARLEKSNKYESPQSAVYPVIMR